MVGILFIFAGAVTGIGEYYLLPRIQVRRVAQNLYAPLVETKESLEKVSSDFSKLLVLISGEEEPVPQTSLFDLPALLERLKEKVAGESAKFALYDLLYQLRKDLLLISSSFSGAKDFGRVGRGAVAGTRVSQLESEVTADLRLVMAKARHCGESIAASRSKLLFLSSSLPQRFPGPLAATGVELESLIQESESYLLEAERIAHYYEVITDVQIELVPATISLVNLVQDLYLAPRPTIYLGKINTLAGTVDDLKREVETLSDSLPAGMEKLHEDNLAVFTLFSKLLAETRMAVSKDDFSRFDRAVADFEAELEVLATRAKSYELSFWQETVLFEGYEELSSRYDQIETKLVKLH